MQSSRPEADNSPLSLALPSSPPAAPAPAPRTPELRAPRGPGGGRTPRPRPGEERRLLSNRGPSPPPQALARFPSPDALAPGQVTWLGRCPLLLRLLARSSRAAAASGKPLALPSHGAGERAAEPVPRLREQFHPAGAGTLPRARPPPGRNWRAGLGSPGRGGAAATLLLDAGEEGAPVSKLRAAPATSPVRGFFLMPPFFFNIKGRQILALKFLFPERRGRWEGGKLGAGDAPRWVRWRRAGRGREGQRRTGSGCPGKPPSRPLRTLLSVPRWPPPARRPELGRESGLEGPGQRRGSSDPDLDRRSRNWK